MRNNLCFSSLLLGAGLLLTTSVLGQLDRFAYAITDLTKEGSSWNALRVINTQTGQYSDIILNGTDLNAYDASTKKPYQAPADPRYGNYMQPVFSTGVAAIAYDKKNSRLYFTPMFIDQLRYVDLNSMKVYYITDQEFTHLGNMHNDDSKIVTRMVIAPDGNGYAISNDGNSFIRFSTGKKLNPVLLGSLNDDPSNKEISIHNRCSSFGGDMVADNDGHLFIISASNHVFKVNINNRVTKYLGIIKGLPQQFTTNGLVVDDKGALLASSAVYAKSYFLINPFTWTAAAYNTLTPVYRSSDLANSNFLNTRKNSSDIALIGRNDLRPSDKIQIFPNPVSTSSFTVLFNKMTSGDYNIQLTDVTGRQVMQHRVNISGETQTENITLQPVITQGIYLVKVTNRKSKTVFSQKLMILR